jgi:glycerol-3-phosphate dehydrogenase
LLPAGEADGVSGLVPPACEQRVVAHYCANEWALHLEDVMVRRTGWHYYLTDRQAVSRRVADWMDEAFGWSPERKAEERRVYEALLS